MNLYDIFFCVFIKNYPVCWVGLATDMNKSNSYALFLCVVNIRIALVFSYVVVIFCADSFDTECPQTYCRKGKT